MAEPIRRLVAVLNDLMFTVKIQQVAKQAGFETVFVKSQVEALAQAKGQPQLMILDLNHAPAQPLEVIAALKHDAATRNIKLIGYVAHVQDDLRQAAKALGCDVVVARSAFSQNLPALLQ